MKRTDDSAREHSPSGWRETRGCKETKKGKRKEESTRVKKGDGRDGLERGRQRWKGILRCRTRPRIVPIGSAHRDEVDRDSGFNGIVEGFADESPRLADTCILEYRVQCAATLSSPRASERSIERERWRYSNAIASSSVTRARFSSVFPFFSSYTYIFISWREFAPIKVYANLTAGYSRLEESFEAEECGECRVLEEATRRRMLSEDPLKISDRRFLKDRSFGGGGLIGAGWQLIALLERRVALPLLPTLFLSLQRGKIITRSRCTRGAEVLRR